MSSSCLALSLRTYGTHHAVHSHAFDQLVLPLDGELQIDVEGREARLIPGRIAMVAHGQSHTQMAQRTNHSLILDLAPQALRDNGEALLETPFHDIGPAALKLIEFMELTLARGVPPEPLLAQWTSLLLGTLGQLQSPHKPVRLDALIASVMRNPGADWSVPHMAAFMRLSPSRLHALFREELDCTPQIWLGTQRMRLAHMLLCNTRLSVGEIAHRCGYTDQSAFARAAHRAWGCSPAKLRQGGA